MQALGLIQSASVIHYMYMCIHCTFTVEPRNADSLNMDTSINRTKSLGPKQVTLRGSNP